MNKLILFILFSACATIKPSNQSWYYKLQNYGYMDFITVKDSFIVLDSYKDRDTQFTKEYLSSLQDKGNTVFSYLSIGEAEEYRPYFKTLNKSMLFDENKNWKGNFRVKYWDTTWENIIHSYGELIINQGFNGVYLDIIDAFHYYQDKRLYANRMSHFIIKLSQELKHQNPTFQIILQNGIDIINYIDNKDELIKNIDGISIEAALFNYNEKTEATHLIKNNPIINLIRQFSNQGKVVLSVEYLKSKQHIADYFKVAKSLDIIPLVTDHGLSGRYFYAP